MRSLSGWLGLALVFGVCAGCDSSGDDDGDDTGGAGTAGTPAMGGSSGGGAGNAAGVSGTGAAAGTGAGSGGRAGGSGVTTAPDFCQTALLCEDFESQPLGAVPITPWSIRTTSGAAVVIDGTQRVSGEKAVKLTTPLGSSSKSAMLRAVASPLFPVAGNAFYGRMMYRLEAQPTTDVHWNMIVGRGAVPEQTYRAEYRYGGQQPVTGGSQLMANYETPDWYNNKATPGSDCWHHSSGKVLPSAAWACVEWKFESNQMHFWLDGVALEDLTVADHGQGCVNATNDFTWTAPTFSQLELGWESFQTDEARTAYIDDVVIATTRVGCPSAN